MARQPLGRGLNALLGDPAKENGVDTVNEIDIDLIDPNPEQPRTRFVDSTLDDLAQSIRSYGVVQSIVVRKKAGRYQIVAGERRWRAAQRAGLRRIPVVVREIADDKLLEIALIENIQRHELNAVEEARAYRKLVDTIGFTQDELADRIGKERSLISTSMRILKLPSEILQLIEEDKISASHGRVLLTTNEKEHQLQVAEAIIDFGLSVRQTERMIRGFNEEARVNVENKPVEPKVDPNVRDAEDRLKRVLGTNVKILSKGSSGAGKIEVEYYNLDDLNRLFDRLVNSKEV